jgi:hypothetical protein
MCFYFIAIFCFEEHVVTGPSMPTISFKNSYVSHFRTRASSPPPPQMYRGMLLFHCYFLFCFEEQAVTGPSLPTFHLRIPTYHISRLAHVFPHHLHPYILHSEHFSCVSFALALLAATSISTLDDLWFRRQLSVIGQVTSSSSRGVHNMARALGSVLHWGERLGDEDEGRRSQTSSVTPTPLPSHLFPLPSLCTYGCVLRGREASGLG